ncbi:MAG: DUF4276 family protein [Prevotellaceae bacterium]|jgi:hypothetical protein|nr:DUF4276 family protein [Prevotellaceae bacterium]
MKVYIVGEDPVTYTIIKRILAYCSDDFEIIAELPARGGQVKSKIAEFNKLSYAYPVVLLIDLDNNDCAPQLVKQLISNKNDNFIFNIAVDEAEAWLMADREGFANYFKIMLEDMPSAHQTKQGGRKTLTEMNFAYKSSMFLTHELIKKSKHLEFVQQLTPKKGAAKGPEYNSCMLPFILKIWNIDSARQNADSLNRMIVRLQNMFQLK